VQPKAYLTHWSY